MSAEEEAAFLSAIRAAPHDDAPRLIYADWLEEQGGQAKADRAELIRLQCLLDSRAWSDDKPLTPKEEQELEASERNLLEAHWEEWTQPMRDLGATAVEFRHGFPHIRISASSFLANAARIFEQSPAIQSVHITGLTHDQMTELAGSEHLRNLTMLDLSGNVIGPDGAEALADSEHLRNLTTLCLWNNRIGVAGVAALAGSEHLRNLTTLDLGLNRIGDAGVAALAGSEHLRNLTTLNLSGNRIRDAGVVVLAGSENLRNLTTLDLWVNRIGVAGVAALAGSEHLRNLTTLDLGLNRIGVAGVAALAGSEHLRNLTTLDLSGNVIPETIVNGITQMLDSRRNNQRE